jgi:hypothetical protein
VFLEKNSPFRPRGWEIWGKNRNCPIWVRSPLHRTQRCSKWVLWTVEKYMGYRYYLETGNSVPTHFLRCRSWWWVTTADDFISNDVKHPETSCSGVLAPENGYWLFNNSRENE